MSEQTPHGDFSAGFDEPATGTAFGGRSLRALLAGAAGVAVLGAFTGGYLWLSSDPGAGASASAVAPAGAANGTPSGQATSVATGSGSGFAFGGRDLFDGSFLPTPGAGGSGGGSTSAASGSGSTSASTTKAPSTSAATTSPSKTSAGTTPGAGTSKPGASASTPATTPAPVSKPAPSAAAPWLKGSVTFVSIPNGSTTGAATVTLATDGVNPVTKTLVPGDVVPSTSTVYQPHGTTTERGMDDAEKAACQKSIQNAATTEAANAIDRKSKGCTVTEAYVWQAVFVPSSQASAAASSTEDFGWIPAAGSALPDAALGKVTGTVRFLAARDDRYLVQVDDESPQWLSKGGAVSGTKLTFVGIGLDSIQRSDVATFSDGTATYFTVLGGGEGSGVTF